MARPASVRIVATRDEWLAALTPASRAIDSHSIVPVLASVLLVVEGDAVAWWSTNGNLWRGGRLEASEVAGAGRVLAPCKLLTSMLKALPSAPVTLAWAGDRVDVKCGSYASRVPVLDAEDFPLVPDVSHLAAVSVEAAGIRRALEFAELALHPSSGSYYQRAVRWLSKGSALTFCSTDGHRLASSSVEVEPDAVPVPVLVPGPALAEWRASLEKVDSGSFSIEGGGYVVLRSGSDTVITKSVDDQFPNVERLMVRPKSSSSATIERVLLQQSLARVALSADATRKTGVAWSLEAGACQLSAKSADRGESSERIAADSVDGACVFVVDPSYVRDFLTTADTERVSISVESDVMPVRYMPGDESGFLYLVMPMRP